MTRGARFAPLFTRGIRFPLFCSCPDPEVIP